MKPVSASIISKPLPAFWALLADLPQRVREQAEDRYKNYFCVDPHHPLLNGRFYNHRLDDRRVLRVEAGGYYRALAFIDEGPQGQRTYTWFWIGSHETYNGVVARLLY